MTIIRETFDAGGNVASAISVYVALCEIASDEGRETFSKPSAFIGFRAGVHRNTVKRVMPALREIGLISYPDAKGLRTPYETTLLSMNKESATWNNDGATWHIEKKNHGALVQSNERNGKTLKTKHETKVSGARFSIPGFEELCEDGQSIVSFYNVELPKPGNGWLPVTKITSSLSEAINRAITEGGEVKPAMKTIQAVTLAPDAVIIREDKHGKGTRTLEALLWDNPQGPDGWYGTEESE